MRPKSLLFVLAVTACLAPLSVSAAPSGSATGPELRTVLLALSPEDAAVAVDGHPRQHANGVLELRGPLGSVFTVEAVANGGMVVQRIAVTDVGALPARLVVPPPSAVLQTWPMPTPPMVVSPADDCSVRTWHDNQGVKHYKRQCLDDEAAPGKPRTGTLSVVCLPKCDHVLDNVVDLGTGDVVQRPVAPGMHSLTLSAPNGVKKTLAVEVLADQLRAVRITMDSSKNTIAAIDPFVSSSASAAPAVPLPVADDGFLTVTSYPWTRVSENGKELCLTPCVKVRLAPGAHTLLLENAAESVKQNVSVTIRSGEITVKGYGFK